MRAAGAVVRGRRWAEALMVDTLVVDVPTGGTTTNPNTLAEVPIYGAPIYNGPGRIQRSGAMSPRDNVAGGFEFGVGTPIAQLPLSATGIPKGARVTVAAIGDTTDPDLLGLVATVQANLTKTHPTKRTLVCEEVT